MGELEELCTLSGHSAAAWSVCWHPTEPLLASCSSDKSIRLYAFTQKASFQHVNTLPAAHNRTIRQIAFSPDGRRMASASFDSTVGIWERNTGHRIADNDSDDDEADTSEEWENVGSLEGHESEVKSVAWSYDGGLLATCGRDKSVWIWDANTPDEDFECLAVLIEHTQDVKQVSFSPTEEILASSSYDDTVKLYASDYSSDEWTVTHHLPPLPPKHYNFPNAPEPEADESGTGHTNTVWCSAFSPDGNYLASCSDDLTIRVWARFKRKNVKGEPGGAFRVGRTEKEGWYLASVLENYHDRTIFSVDWTVSGAWQPTLTGGEQTIGRIASVGGDGQLCVIGMIAKADDSERCGFVLRHELLCAREQAHGVYDINSVQWCRLGISSSSTDNSNSATGSSQHHPSHDVDMHDTDANTHEAMRDRKAAHWRSAQDLLATAADDGSIKVWRFPPQTSSSVGHALQPVQE